MENFVFPRPFEAYHKRPLEGVTIEPNAIRQVPLWIKENQERSARVNQTLGIPGYNPLPHFRYVLITDDNVAELYGRLLIQNTNQLGVEMNLIPVEPGENSKNYATMLDICNRLADQGYGRNTVLVALGGGLVGDLVGEVASGYKRGVPYIQVPTTLLAQVDSSIGGKTGVNTEFGKNMIGHFNEAIRTFTDPELLRTLPARAIRSGLAEVIKYGAIEMGIFEKVEGNIEALLNLDMTVLTDVITDCVSLKRVFVTLDPEDHYLRNVLNFGHTIGQAVETASNYQLTHGEAVSIGMVYESELAVRNALWEEEDQQRLISLIRRVNLPTQIPENVDLEDIMRFMRSDKKREGEGITFVIANFMRIIEGIPIGEIFWGPHSVPEEEVRKILVSKVA